MKKHIDGTKTYEMKCPVCDRVVLADNEETGEITSFTPCEHMVLHYHTGGYFEAFNNMSPNMKTIIEAYTEASALEYKARFFLDDEPALDEETYNDMVEADDIWGKIETAMKYQAETHLLVALKLRGGCCSGPTFNYTDTFVFKLGAK